MPQFTIIVSLIGKLNDGDITAVFYYKTGNCMTKNHNNFDNMASFKSLYISALKCANNVRWKESVQVYLRNILTRTIKLSEDLKNGMYKIQKCDQFLVYEPKKRTIYSVRFRDRIVQRSMCDNGFYDEITNGMIADNCACLKGKGIDYTIARLKYHLRGHFNKYGNNGYVLKIDIKKFFDSIPISIAKNAVEKRIKTIEFKSMIFDVLDNNDGVLDFGDGFGKRGVTLGSQISQLIANSVLDDLDHFIKDKLMIKHYVRYMDDMIIVINDAYKIKELKVIIQHELSKIGLQLNPKTTIYKFNSGITFLKYRFRFTDTGRLIITSNRKSDGRERKKLKKLYLKWNKGELSDEDIHCQLSSWISHIGRSNSYYKILKMKIFAIKLYGEWMRKILFSNKIFITGFRHDSWKIATDIS